MTHFLRTALFAALALATPLAFAQDAATEQAQATDAQAQDATATEQAPTAATSEKKSWADVDTNKDGNLSRDEAAVVPALGSVFDAADANADGSLTADEYKAHATKAQQGEGDKAPRK